MSNNLEKTQLILNFIYGVTLSGIVTTIAWILQRHEVTAIGIASLVFTLGMAFGIFGGFRIGMYLMRKMNMTPSRKKDISIASVDSYAAALNIVKTYDIETATVELEKRLKTWKEKLLTHLDHEEHEVKSGGDDDG